MGRILLVVGTRPNFIKVAPLYKELSKIKRFEITILHTGQHYDDNMSNCFFKELDIPWPHHNLHVGSSSHAIQTSQIMEGFDKFLDYNEFDMVIVVGDVNSSLACALVCAKRGIKLAHIESGPRTGEKSPEEINRKIIDHISDILFATSDYDVANLKRENIDENKIYNVGNIMIDSIKSYWNKIESTQSIKLAEPLHDCCLVTLHRPSNVDSYECLTDILDILHEISKKNTVIFPIHPRTKMSLIKNRKFFNLTLKDNIYIIDPLPYFGFISLLNNVKFVITDSGGIQSEASILKTPIILLRDVSGFSYLYKHSRFIAGINKDKIMSAINEINESGYRKVNMFNSWPKFWDGKTSERIAKVIDMEVD